MTTKKKTNDFAALIEQADRDAIEKAQQAREDLAHLKDSIERWNDEYYEAAGRVSGMKARFARGIETATPAEFAEALAAEERAKLLANKHILNNDPDGEDQRIKRAERALPPSDKKVAKAVAQALVKANTFPAAQVYSTFADVRTLVPTEADTPVLIVSQSQDSWDGNYQERQYGRRAQFSGVTCSADVTLTLYRRPEHRDILPERVVKAITEAAGEVRHSGSLHVLTTTLGSGLEKDEVRFTVAAIQDPSASPELRARYEEWIASRKTTLTQTFSEPQSGWNTYMGVGR
ncbi:hypothetical protein ACFYWN_00365 [Streptomyces sp. NPDC002917]|uniref:hypothetical protein n=1 Tax=Streptomyces sp. NPDC002917 TaxID=3364671 RepID=UPI0036A5BC6E